MIERFMMGSTANGTRQPQSYLIVIRVQILKAFDLFSTN